MIPGINTIGQPSLLPGLGQYNDAVADAGGLGMGTLSPGLSQGGIAPLTSYPFSYPTTYGEGSLWQNPQSTGLSPSSLFPSSTTQAPTNVSAVAAADDGAADDDDDGGAV